MAIEVRSVLGTNAVILPLPKGWYNKTVVFLGTSITLGIGTSDDENRFSSLICAEKEAVEVNLGESFATGQITFDADTDVPSWTSSHKKLIIEYCTNDILGVGGGYNIPDFTSHYEEQAVIILEDKNVPAEDVIMLSSFYIDPVVMEEEEADEERQLAYNQAIKDVCDANGFLYIDCLTPMLEHDDPDSLLDDGVHLNDAGALFIKNLILEKIQTPR